MLKGVFSVWSRRFQQDVYHGKFRIGVTYSVFYQRSSSKPKELTLLKGVKAFSQLARTAINRMIIMANLRLQRCAECLADKAVANIKDLHCLKAFLQFGRAAFNRMFVMANLGLQRCTQHLARRSSSKPKEITLLKGVKAFYEFVRLSNSKPEKLMMLKGVFQVCSHEVRLQKVAKLRGGEDR
ncbi:MAG: hypothetical protein LBT59_31220 [Clostridiales bacterium]|nr:hypothetical protein [Clostridiales bacterium]